MTQRMTAAAIVAGLTMTLFTMSAFAVEADEDSGVKKETMFSLIKKGGPIMIPLGLASLLAVALGLERLISQTKERVMPDSFVEGLKGAWKEDPSGAKATAYCDEEGGTVGHIFKAGIRQAKQGRAAVEKAIDDVGSREADKMKRSLRPLRNIALVAPLMGLLGTVYGMIDAFQKTSMSGGTAKTAMLATGIYEALVTTATGLTIAIPVLLFYQFLLGRVDRLIDDIDEAGTEFVHAYSETSATDKPAKGKAGASKKKES